MNKKGPNNIVLIEEELSNLEKLLKKKGKSLDSVSSEMGYSSKYLIRACTDGLSKVCMGYLQGVYGITYDDIKVEKKSADSTVITQVIETEKFSDIKDELHQVVYSAVYEAIKMALSEYKIPKSENLKVNISDVVNNDTKRNNF